MLQMNGVRSCLEASIQDLTPSDAFPIEFGLRSSTVNLQGALLADRVRALEDPVLPRGEAAEDARQHRLRAGEAQARFHGGKRVGREAGALLDGEPDLLVPVDVVGRRGDEAELERLLGVP